MRYELIIDGYNLMHAAGLARERYAQGDLERSRKRLLSLVRHGLTQKQRSSTTIVFDGQHADGFGDNEFRFHGMQVIFSNPQQEADDVIEALIAAHSFPKQLRVISSDHRLHKAGRVRRAEVIDSEEFLLELERRKHNSQRTGSQPEPPPEKPVQFDSEQWLEEFEEIDLEEIETDLEQEAQRANELRQAELLRRKRAQKPQKSEDPKASDDEIAEKDVSNHDLENSPFDLEFWENRIAELDQEEL